MSARHPSPSYSSAITCSRSAFYDFLRDTDFRVLVAHNIESAVLCSYTEPIDGVLIYQDERSTRQHHRLRHEAAVSQYACRVDLYGIRNEGAVSGIDAVCYTDSLDDEMPRIVTMLFRDLLIKQLCPTNDSLEHVDERPRPFVVQRP